MEGLVTAGSTTPGLTFSYAPAEIQGLTGEPGRLAAQPGPIRRPIAASIVPIAAAGGRPGIPPVSYDSFISHSDQAAIRLPQPQPQPQTPPVKERPRIRGRMTPYAFFVQQRRQYYRQQNIPVQFTAFSKECSALWKVMGDEEKQKYQKLAEEDRERYRREVTGMERPLSKDGTRRGRKKKEPGQPKRNMCAFLHFCSAKRPNLKQENPSLSVGAMARQLSSAWKLMTSDQKKPYDESALRDKQRYEQQKQAYEAGYSAAFLRTDLPTSPGGSAAGGGLPAGPGALMGQVVAPRHRRRKKDPDMPRRNMSAFMFYSLQKRPDVKALNPSYGVGKLAQRLAAHWKIMTSEDKTMFDLMARKDKERYVGDLKAYKKGVYSGVCLSARQVAQAVVSEAHSPVSEKSPVDDERAEEEGEGGPPKSEMEIAQAQLHTEKEQQSPSGDELDQLCNFYP